MLPAQFTPKFLRQLELLRIRSRRAFLGTRQGGHLSPKRGHGIEFSDYRKYELGDNPRHIDWGVYARSERLYVKRFQEEQNLSVLFLLDGSASMVTPKGDGKWERARDLTLALSYVALMQHDSVSVCVPGVFYSPRYSGAGAFHQMSTALAEIDPGIEVDLIRGVQRSLSQIRFPGVAILISDFLMPLEYIVQMTNLIRAKNLDTRAIQVLGPADLSPLESGPLAGQSSAIAIDSETGEEIQLDLSELSGEEYSFLLEKHNKELREFFSECGIGHTTARSDQDLSEFVVDNLTRTGLLG